MAHQSYVKMGKFEFIEHTADLGIKIYSDSLRDLFEDSCDILFDIILDSKPDNPDIEESIILEAQSYDELLVTWFNELISIFYTYKFLPLKCSLSLNEVRKTKVLKAKLEGVRFDPYQEKVNTEIKAATYHDLEMKKIKQGYCAKVIFDL